MSPSHPVRTKLPFLGEIGFWMRKRPVLAAVSLVGLSCAIAAILSWDRLVALGEDLERSRARSFFERGMRAWHEGAVVTARLCFETALSIDSSNIDVALTLGRLQLQQGNRANRVHHRAITEAVFARESRKDV